MAKRKESRETLEARLREKTERTHLLEMAIHRLVAMDEKPIAAHAWDLDIQGRVTWELFDPTGPIGGFVLTRFACDGQNDYVDIQRLDDLNCLARRMYTTLDERIACEKFTAAREQAFDAKHRPAAA